MYRYGIEMVPLVLEVRRADGARIGQVRPCSAIVSGKYLTNLNCLHKATPCFISVAQHLICFA